MSCYERENLVAKFTEEFVEMLLAATVGQMKTQEVHDCRPGFEKALDDLIRFVKET